MNKEEKKDSVMRNSKGMAFAGSAACANCHKNICDKHISTAHYQTTQPASEKTIKGSFEQGRNIFYYNEFTSVAMEKRPDGYYQVEYVDNKEKRKQRFDIVVGSGTKGQTFLYWNKNRLFQLPVFYFAGKDEWANSPGFSGRVIFNRPITSRCLECHSTYVNKTSEPGKEPEDFDKNEIIYGVSCEKCHGPAAKHVAYHTQNPGDKNARYIINPAVFSRQQSLDLCKLCHGGRLAKTKPSFEFEAGDTLANYFAIDTSAKDAADIDVHGNQFGLLAASKCFKLSNMTCITCHNSHENEVGKLALFSSRCLTCHSKDHGKLCKLTNEIGSTITQNCIDCHMPIQPSKAIMFLEQGNNIPTAASMRSHFIKIYPDEAQKILTVIKNLPKKTNR